MKLTGSVILHLYLKFKTFYHASNDIFDTFSFITLNLSAQNPQYDPFVEVTGE